MTSKTLNTEGRELSSSSSSHHPMNKKRSKSRKNHDKENVQESQQQQPPLSKKLQQDQTPVLPPPPLEVPSKYICPLTLETMKDPVVSRYGQNYERSAILTWLQKGHTSCPMTRQPLRLGGLVTNVHLRKEISSWKKKYNYHSSSSSGCGESQSEDGSVISTSTLSRLNRTEEEIRRMIGVVIDVSESGETDDDFYPPLVETRYPTSSRSSSSSNNNNDGRMSLTDILGRGLALSAEAATDLLPDSPQRRSRSPSAVPESSPEPETPMSSNTRLRYYNHGETLRRLVESYPEFD